MPDFDTLYNESNTNAMSGGKKRFYDNKVSNIESNNDNGKLKLSTSVKGEDSIHNVKIIFDEQGGLYDYSCDCSNFSITDGPCKHIVATALSYEERNPTRDKRPSNVSVKARTDAAVINLISEYAKRKHKNNNSSDFKSDLVPIIIQDNGSLSLKFLIGKKRKYTLKDISDFVSAFHSNGYRRYGAELSVWHNDSSFNDRSNELIKFVRKCYHERAEMRSEKDNIYRDELKLLQNDIDKFMALYSGQVVAFADRNLNNGVRLIQDKVNDLGVSLSIEKVPSGYKINFPIEKFDLCQGRDYTYIITESKIIKCTDEFIYSCMPLFKSSTMTRRLFASEIDMPSVYNNIIVQILDYVNIESDSDLTVFEAPPLEAKLFLDVIDGVIYARVEANYDDISIDIIGEEYNPDIIRDWECENTLTQLLQKYFVTYPNLEISLESEIYKFLQEGLNELGRYAEIYVSDSLKKIKVRRPPKIKVGVRLNGDLIDVELNSEDLTSAELIEVLKAYRQNLNYVRLASGAFVDLSDPSIGALSEVLQVAGVEEDKLTLPKSYAPYLDNELKNGFFILERSGEFKSLIKSLYETRDSDIEVPKSLSNIMRNYQKTGYRWLKTLSSYNFGGILADDMGLGKSLQIISLLLSCKGTSIIVCPTTLILNWINEFNKFAPNLKILGVMGSLEERKALVGTIKDYDVVVTSYELMRRDEGLYADTCFEYAVIDEAQFIKNPDTISSKSVKTLKSKYRFALTGTPIENSLAELWSIFDFIMPYYLYSYPQFRERFEVEIVKGNKHAAERLQKLVAPFILRRLKSGVLKELPPKIETEIVSPLEDEQKNLYNMNLQLIKDNIKNSGESNKVVILSQLTKLRQICCAPELVYPNYNGNCAKLDTCLGLVDSAIESGHKVLIFSQFTSMLDILRDKLGHLGITHYMLKGDTPKVERMRLVTSFNENDIKVFLISLKAGGTGLNLTGADVVIHYDPWWNESVMNQATDRAYRMGQDKSVQVYKLIMGGSIEEKIMKLQEKKSALSNLLVGKAFDINEVLDLL